MSRAFKTYGGEDLDPVEDFSDLLKWEEAEFGYRTYEGEATQSQLPLHDPEGEISASGASRVIYTRNVMEMTLDGQRLWKGRRGRMTSEREFIRVADRERLHRINADDGNVDLRGIVVHGWDRPEESDVERVQALAAEFLAGSPRATTDLDASTYVPNTNLTTLPAYTYNRTDPFGVLQEIGRQAAKNFFVTIDDELFYDTYNSSAYATTLSISDRPADIGAGGGYGSDALCYGAQWLSGPPIEFDGTSWMSGARLFYGSDETSWVEENSSSEADDGAYWVVVLSDTNATNETQAARHLSQILARGYQGLSYNVAIGPLTDAHAKLLKPGHLIDIKSRVIGAANDFIARRITLLTWKWTTDATGSGEGGWYAYMELEAPHRKLHAGLPVGPRPPTPSEPPTVTTGRLYYTGQSDGTSGVTSADYAGSWDAALSVTGPHRLRAAPQDTLSGAPTGSGPDSINLAAGTYVSRIYTCPLTEQTGLLAAVQNGSTWRTVIRSKNREGLGVTESTQFNYPSGVARVWRPGTSSFVGTIFDIADFTAAYRFDITSPSVWPSIPQQATGAAVAGAVGTDYLVVDLGAEHDGPTTGATGWAWGPKDSSSVADLPFVVDSLADQNSWLEFSGASSGGSPGPGPDLIGAEGTGANDCYANCGHKHHVVRDRAPTPADDEVGYPAGTFWVQVDDLDDPTTIVATFLSLDDTAGAAVWLPQAIPSGPSGSTLTIAEEDLDPSGVFSTLLVPNGRLTDNGDGSASLDLAASVHSHAAPDPGFVGVSLRRTTNFTTTDSNTSIPDFDEVEYDTDGFWDAGDPERITIPAACDGLMMQIYASGLWGTGVNSGEYCEMKIYRNGTAVEAPLAVSQHAAVPSYNVGQIALTRPIQVAEGDYFTITFRTHSSETLVTYDDMSAIFAAWVVSTPGPEGPPGADGADGEGVPTGGSAGQVLTKDSGTDFDTSWQTPSASGGGVGRILISDTHSTPLVFGDLLQNDDGDNLLYEDA